MKTMILIILFIISLVPLSLQECHRFEFHETIESSFSLSDSIRDMCNKKGRIVDYSSQLIKKPGPPIFNVTFQCCAPSYCLSDHDCPINFNCKNGICSVAECEFTEEPEILWQEGQECLIDDDCSFYILPYDSENWKCLPDPRCSHGKTCDDSYNFCKRCPTGYIDADPKRFTGGNV
uniref:WAP domain-containing protein n=1 Tax=Tetranychus urticae TaxID=32264 RepID=T1KPZ9_TETUR